MRNLRLCLSGGRRQGGYWPFTDEEERINTKYYVEERDTTIEELQAKLAVATPGKSDPRPPRGPGCKYPPFEEHRPHRAKA